MPRARSAGELAFSMIEVVVVAAIVATSLLLVLNLGQANTQLSRINQESLLARQVISDMLTYYASHLDAAKIQGSPDPKPDGFLERHIAFRDCLQANPGLLELLRKMKPVVVFNIHADVETPEGSGGHNPDLHQLVCTVRWNPLDGTSRQRSLTLSRLVSELE